MCNTRLPRTKRPMIGRVRTSGTPASVTICCMHCTMVAIIFCIAVALASCDDDGGDVDSVEGASGGSCCLKSLRVLRITISPTMESRALTSRNELSSSGVNAGSSSSGCASLRRASSSSCGQAEDYTMLGIHDKDGDESVRFRFSASIPFIVPWIFVTMAFLRGPFKVWYWKKCVSLTTAAAR